MISLLILGMLNKFLVSVSKVIIFQIREMRNLLLVTALLAVSMLLIFHAGVTDAQRDTEPITDTTSTSTTSTSTTSTPTISTSALSSTSSTAAPI